MQTRREFLTRAGCGALALAGAARYGSAAVERPNVILITVDDMNWDAAGVLGCKVPDITPNMDRLAGEGMSFMHAHVAAAICQPCRQSMMTGRWPHANSKGGFDPIRPDVPTLQEQLRPAGYFQGIFAKVPHLAPQERFCWDSVLDAKDLGNGRDPDLYYQRMKEFLAAAKASGKPFFLMANSQDPHRPFAGAGAPARRAAAAAADVRRTYKPDEVQVPGFLPDLPEIRTELAQYFTSVHRCDEIVGSVLRALKESGQEESTLVMLISDNGMSFPFSKANCYYSSTRTPWMVRWPGKVKAGSVDDRHSIVGVDFTPTVLEAAGLPPLAGVQGRSFLPVLLGKPQEGREWVFTEICQLSSGNPYPMRCTQSQRYTYIFNAWSNGQTVYRNESQSGLTWKAMQAAAANDAKVAERCSFFQTRVPEELYDNQKDPYGLKNLIDDAGQKDEIGRLRQALLKHLEDTQDPVLPALKRRLANA